MYDILMIVGWIVAALGVLLVLACVAAVFGFAKDTVSTIIKK